MTGKLQMFKKVPSQTLKFYCLAISFFQDVITKSQNTYDTTLTKYNNVHGDNAAVVFQIYHCHIRRPGDAGHS